MSERSKGNAVVGQSGGPTSVINQSLVGVIQAMRNCGGPISPLLTDGKHTPTPATTSPPGPGARKDCLPRRSDREDIYPWKDS